MRSNLQLFHVATLVLSGGLGAQQIPEPQLLLDINKTSPGYSASSSPDGMTADHKGSWRQDRFAKVGSHLFFSAEVTNTGRELYYGGTAPGSAQLAADINPGTASSNPSNFVVVGSKLYFAADDGTNGYQIWEAAVIGGGTAVRRLTSLIETGSDTAIGPMIAKKVGNADFVYFSKFNATPGDFTILGVELAGGTVVPITAPLLQHWSQPVVLGDHIVFEGTDFRGTEAWRLDNNHIAGVLEDYNAGDGRCDYPVVIGDRVYFAAFTGAWGIHTWDRQSPVTQLAALPGEWSNPVVLGTRIIFASGGLAYAVDTAAAAPMVQALPDEAGGAHGAIFEPVVMGNKAYYYGYSSVQPVAGYYLFESDGVTATLIPGTPYSFSGNQWAHPEVVDDTTIFFNFKAGAGSSLYTFDGNTSSRVEIHWNVQSNANAFNITEIDGVVCFSADDGRFGNELWVSDGTQIGTTLHTNIATQMRTHPSDPKHFAAVGRKLMFAADDGIHGVEPWITDGRGLLESPGAGTRMVDDVRDGPLGSNPRWLTGTESVWLTLVEDGPDQYMLASDGTAAGTVPVGGTVVVSETDWQEAITFHGQHTLVLAEDPVHGRGPRLYDHFVNEFEFTTNTNRLADVSGDMFTDTDKVVYSVDADGYIWPVPLPEPQLSPWRSDEFFMPLLRDPDTGKRKILYTSESSGGLPTAAFFDPQTQTGETFFFGTAAFDRVLSQPFAVVGGAAFAATIGVDDFLHWTDGTQANTVQISTTPIFGLDCFENTLTQRESVAVPLGQTDEKITFVFAANGTEVWKVNPTSATRVGTLNLEDVLVAIPLGSHRVAFLALTLDAGYEVFVTDGTEILNISEVLAPGTRSGAGWSDAGLWAMDGKLYFNGIESEGAGSELYTWDAGALAQPYGFGTRDDVRLRAVDPVIGNAAQFSITGAPTSSTLGFVVFAPPAQDSFLFAGERVYVDVTQATTLTMAMAQGEGTLQFPIPNDLALVGARLDIQGAVGPYPNPAGAALTGAQSLTVGR